MTSGQVGRRNSARAVGVRVVRVPIGPISRPAGHPDSAFYRPEQHLASGLYPGALQFKHQKEITLDVLSNSGNNGPYIPSTTAHHVGHGLVGLGLAAGRGLVGDELVETGAHVPVRAPGSFERLFETNLPSYGTHPQDPSERD